MAIAIWPPALPQYPDRNGFEERPKPEVIAFGTETGPGKRRPRSGLDTDLVTASFTLDVDLLATFRNFLRVDLGRGALPFSWVDPRDGLTYRWWFDAEDPYRLTPKGGRLWLVACNLERVS